MSEVRKGNSPKDPQLFRAGRTQATSPSVISAEAAVKNNGILKQAATIVVFSAALPVLASALLMARHKRGEQPEQAPGTPQPDSPQAERARALINHDIAYLRENEIIGGDSLIPLPPNLISGDSRDNTSST